MKENYLTFASLTTSVARATPSSEWFGFFPVYNAAGVAFNGSQNGSLNCNSTDGTIHTEERYCVISCSVHCTLKQCP